MKIFILNFYFLFSFFSLKHNLKLYGINKRGNYFLSMDWAGLKWRPVLKVLEQLQDKDSKEMQKSYRWKALSYSYVKYSSRVPLLLLTVEKIERENFDFVLFLLLSSFFLLLSSVP